MIAIITVDTIEVWLYIRFNLTQQGMIKMKHTIDYDFNGITLKIEADELAFREIAKELI